MNRLRVRLFCTVRMRRPGLVAGKRGALWLLSITCGPLVVVVLRGERVQAGRMS